MFFFLLLVESSFLRKIFEDLDDSGLYVIVDFFMHTFHIGEHFRISIFGILIIVFTFWLTSRVLRVFTRLITKRLTEEHTIKFKSLFSFAKYIIYAIVILEVCQSVGINITPVLTASAALLVGVGLALQTFFQDILSGIFMLLDQTLKVGDVIEFDNEIAKVENIKLRTTRAITVENKVLVIPNHKYLTSPLNNWTQNSKVVKFSVSVGVAYGSDTEKVKQLLLQVVKNHSKIVMDPKPIVLFDNFGDSSLDFKVVFGVRKSMEAHIYKSEIRFEIDRVFRENNIEIPFPQRVVHLNQ